MATLTRTDFLRDFPQFESTSLPALDAQLSRSSRMMEEGVWGSDWSLAVSLDAAHTLTLRNLAVTSGAQGAFQGAMGPITSVSAAGVSTGFASPSSTGKSASKDWYMKTSYGQELLRMFALLPLTDLTA